MKKILLTSIFFFGIGAVLMAQEKRKAKPASSTATKKLQARNQDATYAKQIALKKEKAARLAAENKSPQQEKQKPTAAVKSEQ